MMRRIAQFSVDYPTTVSMMVLAVVLLGYISFTRLGIDLFPDLNNPRLFVELKAGERPPEEIERQFVENIESLAIRQKNVIQVSSVCKVGGAQITVEYTWKADMDESFLDLQKSLSTFGQNSDLEELTVSQYDPNAAPIMVLGLSHPEISDMNELRRTAENYLRNELVRLEGVAEVELIGGEEKEAVVETDDYILEAYNLTPTTIVNRIQNYNRNASGGSIVEMGRKYIIKGVGELKTINEIGDVIVSYKQPDPQDVRNTTQEKVPVFLRDVAKIYTENKEPENIVRINQKRCMALAIYKETKYNTIKAVENLKQALEETGKALPGYQLTIIQNQADFIASAIDEVKVSALIGIVLAVFVLYIFLRRVGVTLIISAAIPISIVATFNLMYFNGLTLNIMTLGGLALGAGMLVDNAIVVMENIFRNMESGVGLRRASVAGAAQVGGAITASTLTTIVVFLPIVYLHGSAGELFKDQAWTVAFSLLASLVVSVLFLPMLSSRFLKETDERAAFRSIQFTAYGNILNRVLNRKVVVIITAALLIVIASLLIPMVGSEFMPKAEYNDYSVQLELAEGTELYRTESTVVDVENMISQVLGEHLKTIYSRIGPSVAGRAAEELYEDENTASIKLSLRSGHGLSAVEVIARIDKVLANIPDLEAQVIQDQTALQTTLGIDIAPVVMEIKGEDLAVIEDLTARIRAEAATLPALTNIQTSFDELRPEIHAVIDRTRAGLFNVDMGTVSTQLEDRLMGKSAGQWEYEGEMQDIMLRLPKMNMQELGDLTFDVSNNKVRLEEIADIRWVQAPREILRRNQSRIGTVTAHLSKDEPFDHVMDQIEKKVSNIEFPAEYTYQITGEEQKRQESFANLKFALILSIILVYMVLASQFESLVHPFTILLTIPLAGVGAIVLFFIIGESLNMMAYIGIIMLAGIAVNDSIILVDRINQMRKDGLTLREAIVSAGEQRIRPIIITSLTTILALLPLTFGFGEGVALRAPLALAVIGGLTTSTALTLFVIPSVYESFEDLRGWIKSQLSHFT